jgi:hypothetical protein
MGVRGAPATTAVELPLSSTADAGGRPGATGFTLLRARRVTEEEVSGAAAAVVVLRGRTVDDFGEATRFVTDVFVLAFVVTT